MYDLCKQIKLLLHIHVYNRNVMTSKGASRVFIRLFIELMECFKLIFSLQKFPILKKLQVKVNLNIYEY